MSFVRTMIEKQRLNAFGNRIAQKISGIQKTTRQKTAFLAGVLFLILLFLFGIFIRLIKVRGQEPNRYKYYTSMEIQSGDTLWSIADEIASTYGLDTRKCVKELKFMNNLTGDTIHVGNYLTVFYYETQ